jgi:hypothetical protein
MGHSLFSKQSENGKKETARIKPNFSVSNSDANLSQAFESSTPIDLLTTGLKTTIFS